MSDKSDGQACPIDLSTCFAEVQRLKDIEEIKQLKACYFRYVDLHWWSELRALFTDDAVFEIGESTSSPKTSDEFVASVGRHLNEAMSVHHGHMPEIRIVDAETAYGIWAMFDAVEPSTRSGYPALTGYGHYTESYRRIDGRWRIARLRLTRLKRSVDSVVLEGRAVDGRRPFIEPW
ncbi:nuclear transport factor 2 family protein [Nocardia nova]|uniref:nuclear transport factor 2 family protein n=1 Tax=Nocardia nova TaxID=37330 RepID=UPI0037B1C417